MRKCFLVFMVSIGMILTYCLFRLKIESPKKIAVVNKLSKAVKSESEKLSMEIVVDSKKNDTREIAQMSGSDLNEELRSGREKIKNERLIERLNNSKLSLEEVNQAKILFERLALMSLENANRKARDLAPEIEYGLDKIGQDLEEIKELMR